MSLLLDRTDINEEVITKLLSLGIGTKEQCIDAYLAADNKTDINEMKQYINNHSSNDTMTDSYTDDIKENIPMEPEEEEDGDDDTPIKLLPVGLLPKYEQKSFILNEEKTEETCPVYGWTWCDSTTFDVRRGPNYISGQKAPSKHSIYEPFAMDTYSVPHKINEITQFMDTDKYIKKFAYPMNKEYPLPPILIINIMVPNYCPEIKKYNHYDGDGYQVIIYAKLSDAVRKLLTENDEDSSVCMTPSIKLFSRFVTEGTLDTNIRDRFKAMGRVMNLKYTGFNYLTKKLISEYNAKPFLAKCSTIIHHKYGSYLSIDLDAHQYGYVAKKCWYHIKDIMENVIYDLAFVIEGHSNDELPEQMLTSVRISKVAAQRQHALSSSYVKKYNKIRRENID